MGGSEPRLRWRWLLRALLVLLLAQWLLVLLATLAGPAMAGQAGAQRWPVLGLAIWQASMVLLRGLPLLLLAWPLLRLPSAILRWLTLSLLWLLWLLPQAGLEGYFQQAGTPLGADLLGYSAEEIRTTLAGAGVSAGQAAGWWLLLPCLLLPFGVAWALSARASGQVRAALPSRRHWLLLAGLCLLAWWLPLDAGLAQLPDQARREQASSKLAWFVADLWRWQQRERGPLASAQAHEPASVEQVTGQSQVLDAGHPLLHAERTPDVLGRYFAPTSHGGPPNVVVVIVEGLGRSFSGPDAALGSFTPFLDRLATQSLYFDSFLANQGRTFGVLPSLLGSLPFAEQGFLALPEPLPDHPGLYQVLGQQGYQRLFYNGTDTRFDNERGYLQAQGVEQIVDLGNFGPGYQTNPHSQWGYADEALASRVIADMAGFKPPFLLGVQTISMHTSYRFPGQAHWQQQLQGHVQALGLPPARQAAVQAQSDIYSTILYTDAQLQRLLQAASQQPWHADTIYLISGDHRLPEIPIGEHIERYHVPLLIHSPLLRQPARIGAVSSQMDVLPSLMALLSAHYGLQRPAQTPWLGRGLDMSTAFSSTGHFPLKQTKTSAEEYLDGRWWLRDGQLYALEKGMRLSAVDDAQALARVQARLHRYQQANAALLAQGQVLASRAPLQAYAQDQVDAPPLPQPASQALPGLGVEDVQLRRQGNRLQVSAAFINGDDHPSAWFVPLAVLLDAQGSERGEVSAAAVQLAPHQRRQLGLTLPLPAGADAAWSVSLRPSDPQTGRASGRGQYRIALPLPAGNPEPAP
ncbi:hypothetical protein ABB30_06255 [Stenotrophomonas ginsengisoli]|uniref:Sulfatase N-terminal domain-containing protein n=4 Tax=Stenotrophomonas TaxID=40323 RepID=A0A0R0DIS2_9GAMM|nr:hypothetical protein ABB30_06255 [Stenotrophomonas ginsengisoli]